MIEYLTRSYSCGENKLTMTPLEYSLSLDAMECHSCIKDHIDNLKKGVVGKDGLANSTAILQKRQIVHSYESKNITPPADTALPNGATRISKIPEVNSERAAEAKAKLIAYREKGKK